MGGFSVVASSLLKWELGKESVFGTPVAPTVFLAGIEPGSSITPVNQRRRVQTMRGTLAPGEEVIQELLGAQASLTMMTTYDQAPIWLDGLFGVASPVGSGPYTRTYDGITSTAATIPSFTIVEGVDVNVPEYGMNGATVFSVQFTGENNAAQMMTVTLEGEDVSTDGFAPIAEPTVTYAMGDHVTLYMDAWGGTFGSTSAGCSFSYDFTISPTRTWKRCLGSLRPTAPYDQRWDVTGSISLEWNSTSDDFLEATFTGSNPRYLLQIKLTNGGAGAAERSLTFNIPVIIDPSQMWTDRDGLMTIDIPISALEETTNLTGNYIEIISVNGDADLYA